MKKSNRKRRLPIKLIIGSGVIFLGLILIIGYIWRFLETCDYFKITDIIGREGGIEELSYLKGKNIFNLDLKRQGMSILEFYPDCSKINLVRVLPNRIFVSFIKRRPIALVKLYRDFSLDGEGVLFYASGQLEEQGLPIIIGLETKIFGARPGRKYIKELAPVLNIIQEFRKRRGLKNYKIRKIDLTNPANTSIFVYSSLRAQDSMGKALTAPEGFEVKLGEDRIKDKLLILASLTMAEKSDPANIKYIDLRFKEAVIKMKDAK